MVLPIQGQLIGTALSNSILPETKPTVPSHPLLVSHNGFRMDHNQCTDNEWQANLVFWRALMLVLYEKIPFQFQWRHILALNSNKQFPVANAKNPGMREEGSFSIQFQLKVPCSRNTKASSHFVLLMKKSELIFDEPLATAATPIGGSGAAVFQRPFQALAAQKRLFTPASSRNGMHQKPSKSRH